MRIQCPSCTAIYEVSDALLDPPRTVRCAQCAHDWMATAMAEPAESPAPPDPVEETAPGTALHAEAAPEPAPAPEPELVPGDTPLSAIERLAAPGSKTSARAARSRLLTSAWAASFAALALLGVAGYAKREALMSQWPASKRVYATFGLLQG